MTHRRTITDIAYDRGLEIDRLEQEVARLRAIVAKLEKNCEAYESYAKVYRGDPELTHLADAYLAVVAETRAALRGEP